MYTHTQTRAHVQADKKSDLLKSINGFFSRNFWFFILNISFNLLFYLCYEIELIKMNTIWEIIVNTI